MKKRWTVLAFVILGFVDVQGFQQSESNRPAPSLERSDENEVAFVHRSIDTDSMLIESGQVYIQVYKFISEGIKVHDKLRTSGPCVGRIKQYALGLDTLTTIKDDCDAGGFENHQFITRNNLLVTYRKYKMELTVDGRTNLSEDIYEFNDQDLILSKRYRTSKGSDDLTFVNFPFKITRRPGDGDYKKIKGWLKGGYSVWRK